jgi:4,5-DOPA dioxygenase extradiol
MNLTPDIFRKTATMPVLFVGHGSPMNALEDNQFTRGWQDIAETIPKPDAILCISAHWETKGTCVTTMDKPKTIHDFGGFPDELYNIQYPAPGIPLLAEEIKRVVRRTEIRLDNSWGLDHGTWSILRKMYPGAEIPVIQMSLDYSKSPESHYAMAGEMASLRKMGVLIIGSGNMVHNLGMVAWSKVNEPEYGFDWAAEANEKMKKLILSGDHKSLIDFRSQGSAFELAIPTAEHFLPLLYILALHETDEKITFFNDKPVMGSLTMTSIKISS